MLTFMPGSVWLWDLMPCRALASSMTSGVSLEEFASRKLVYLHTAASIEHYVMGDYGFSTPLLGKRPWRGRSTETLFDQRL